MSNLPAPDRNQQHPQLNWLTSLLAKNLNTPSGDGGDSFEIDDSQFTQLATSNDVRIKEHKGVTYVSYRGGAFKNCGYIRMPGNSSKPKAHAGKYSLVRTTVLFLSGF